ncbi:MAG: ATP-binding protein [Imperialibacter sp.]|uniref:sensor histidine kinase n=1 Tax=Imperialibacter sp. TaxID=2038411 RepID=UPI0032EF3EA4
MVFDRFRWQVIVRIALILVLGYAGMYIIISTDFWLAGCWLMLFTAIATVSLFRYVEIYRRELYNFLSAIKQGDFTNSFSGHTARFRVDDLKFAYSEIIRVFHQLSSERESQYLFLQTIVEHVRVALVVADPKGEVLIYNRSFTELTGKKFIKNMGSLRNVDEAFYNTIDALEPGQRILTKLLHKELYNLSVQCSSITVKNTQYRIISFQDIRNELEERELDSWQKLIRVLTHEIMNSAIPISTLTSVIREMLEDEAGQPLPLSALDDESAKDVVDSLKTIENRSKGLVRFVEAYRSLTNIQPPRFEKIKVSTLFGEVEKLFLKDFDKKKIKLETETSPAGLEITIDKDLFEQVLINLVKNAGEAVEATASPLIKMSATQDNGNVIISISDNGHGIPSDVLDNIFVPFYTTKKQGSGIGLSLSRQIIRLHKGTLTVNTELGKGTSFVVRV